jgi:hypothetical protein
MKISRLGLAASTALAGLLTLVAPTAARADTTADCVSGGPIAADATTATRLNSVLTGSLTGAMTAYRVSCARAVINAVHQRGLSDRAAVIAVTTTIVESTLRNVTGGDDSSVGLFQQLDSWGSAADRLNPAWATNAFLDKMVRAYPDNAWQDEAVGTVCQKVQVSAYPERYQPQAADAQKIVDALSGPPAGVASVYGALADGRLTYSTINNATGDRTKTVSSTGILGFVPVAMATLNFNTLLATSPAGVLYRVDIVTNNTSLTFDTPVAVGTGWTHDQLTYDGYGHLYGIANGTLLQYVVSRDKPGTDQIGQRKVIGTGFTLKNLTSTGDDWLLGVSTAGELRSYHIAADGTWAGATLASRWSTFSHLVSPGHGVYYGRTPDGAMYHYYDANPFDLSGADLTYYTADPVDTRGWTQILLSAQPANT